MSSPTRGRQALLVLGMHRSGTSALAGVLAKRGCALPRTLMEAGADNPRGYFESRAIMELHDDVLKSAGSHWNDWRSLDLAWYHTPAAAGLKERATQLLDAEFGESPLFVLKDPRTCRFVRFWLDVFRDAEIAAKPVLVVRSPLEVALSLRVREHFTVAEGLFVWLRHTLDAEAATRGMPRAVVQYHALLADWRAQMDNITRHAKVSWPDLMPSAEQEIESFLTSELRHQNCACEGSAHSDMHPWMKSAYEAHSELVQDPASRSACATLDRICAGFDEATALFGRLFVHHVDGELYRLRADYRCSEHAVQRLTGEVERLAGEVQRLSGELQHVGAEHQRLGAVHQTALEEAVNLRAALGVERQRVMDEASLRAAVETERNSAQDACASLAVEKQRAVAEVLALQAALEAEQKRALDARASLEAERQLVVDQLRALNEALALHAIEAADRDAALQAAGRDFNQVRDQIDAMEKSTAWRATQPLRQFFVRHPRLRRLGRQVLGRSRQL